MRAAVYAINAPDVVAEDFDGKIVILNLADGRYFSLEGIGARIWSLPLDGAAPNAILESIGAQQPALKDSSSEFVGRLIEWQLIRPRTRGMAMPAVCSMKRGQPKSRASKLSTTSPN